METILIDGLNLSLADVIAVAYRRAKIEIKAEALAKVQAGRDFLETQVQSGKVIYGINTGFGLNATEIIDNEATAQLQRKLLLSHACGVGANLATEIVRALMLIRLNTLLAGYSGIRVNTVILLQELINRHIHPIIPAQGSVGASGDLCPLSHMALALIGEGKVEYEGNIITAHKALIINDLQAITLQYKEGIALNNGTSLMAALGVVGVYESEKLMQKAILSACLTLEGLGARKAAFDSKIHAVRRHYEQAEIARQIREATENSQLFDIQVVTILQNFPLAILESLPLPYRQDLEALRQGTPRRLPNELYKYLPDEAGEPRWRQWSALLKLAEKKITPQDAYSIRCLPQVLGASQQAINHVKQVMENELNAVVDNPLLFAETEEILSGGNFHGQPLALALDYLKLAVAEIGNILERQINKLVDPATNDFLPAFLVENPGLDSGFMIPQYTAAALVSENKVLVHPASADSIPTSANQEDHVSMGPIAGRQALEIIQNVKKIVAILMLTASQAIDLRQKQLQKAGIDARLGKQTHGFYGQIRAFVPYMPTDRLLYEDIAKILENWEGIG
ncbi:MAG: aromatic amino acid lyase [Microscillaceae bacterium]|jgi:histidine ammonia-lyase|nr:aromatic amino acid lyase [Microscillaceae bacterium]